MKKLILAAALAVSCAFTFAEKLCQHFPGPPAPCPDVVRIHVTVHDLATTVAPQRTRQHGTER